MTEEELLSHLRNLETILHRPDDRMDVDRIDALLHESFVEFGSSGRSYYKADILSQLPSERTPGNVLSQDFMLTVLADGVALLTYKTSHRDEAGQASKYTLRSSLWQRTDQGWKMRFHQGTPTHEFTTTAT